MEMFEHLTVLCLCLHVAQPENSLECSHPPFLPSLQCFTYFIVCFCKGFRMSCFLAAAAAAVYSGTAAREGLS